MPSAKPTSGATLLRPLPPPAAATRCPTDLPPRHPWPPQHAGTLLAKTPFDRASPTGDPAFTRVRLRSSTLTADKGIEWLVPTAFLAGCPPD
ncbi:MAG: hypothetical protein R3B70_44250 [Polyangiaceae bacterium]